MIEQIYNYFTIETLYLWVNIGVLPVWLLIIFFPQSQLCKYIATSIFPIFLLGAVYFFVLYKSYLNSYNFLGNFNLYMGINYLSDLFDENSYLLLFWIHFISINLFTGGWVLKDSQRFFMNKYLLALPLIVIYLIGPIGLFFYWIMKIFYAKKISLHE
ncbi:ABA4-like family protein [Candidatus Pelagibacter sp.]|nr:ABA4-like family protein [Candidatus Pelagibacter sp.]